MAVRQVLVFDRFRSIIVGFGRSRPFSFNQWLRSFLDGTQASHVFRGEGRAIVPLESEANVSHSHFVARLEIGLDHPVPVDSNAIHAPQIAQDKPIPDLNDTAMTARNFSA